MRIDALLKRIDKMLIQIDTRLTPKTWHFCIEEGTSLPDHIRSQLGPYDTVIIRQCPKGLLN